ncbi:MAG: SIMPL domain-containing protein [Gemmatimonadota bacterium]
MKRHLLATALLLAPAAATAQQAEAPRTVSVNATATVERAPDEAVLNVAVVTEAETAGQAASANADRMAAVVATLRELGLENRDIRTTSYNLSPRYARTQPREGQTAPMIVGYTATNNVSITVDSIPRVGPVIDAVVRDGANRVDGIFFRISEPEPLHMEAVRRAVARARAEAEVLASAAGERLGRVLTITTSGYTAPPPRPMYNMDMVRMESAQAAPTPIEGGEQSVSASVSMVFELVGGGAP